ncbi:MAG: SCP2 sterol-binding domain-containing protein [Betaproteobacteria bacterium]|nr:SCP2 sterol-binding domain-containing protein [Betaproteobacteria bacterium]
MNAPIMPTASMRRRKVLPRPIRQLVRNLPHLPSSAVVATVLNLTLRRRLPRETLEQLEGRVFFVEVRDVELVMAFKTSGRRFYPVPPVGEPALRFRVNASDFAVLAEREDRPDGLFLHDLVVVGDPKVAQAVRETLARLDVTHARKLIARVVRHVERTAGPG